MTTVDKALSLLDHFSHEQTEIGLSELRGQLYAFGDLNADGSADLLVGTGGGDVLQTWQWNSKRLRYNALERNTTVPGLVGVIPGSFANRDNRIDLLLLQKRMAPWKTTLLKNGPPSASSLHALLELVRTT